MSIVSDPKETLGIMVLAFLVATGGVFWLITIGKFVWKIASSMRCACP